MDNEIVSAAPDTAMQSPKNKWIWKVSLHVHLEMCIKVMMMYKSFLFNFPKWLYDQQPVNNFKKLFDRQLSRVTDSNQTAQSWFRTTDLLVMSQLP